VRGDVTTIVSVRIAFVLNDVGLSGGAIVALRHASLLSSDFGHDVCVLTVRGRNQDWVRREFPGLLVETIDSLGNELPRFDVAIATFWDTLFVLERIPSSRYVWFAQSLEDRFYSSDEPIGALAGAVSEVPIAVITEANWIRDVLLKVNPRRSVHIARNGIDKELFTHEGRSSPLGGEGLRVLIEGEPKSHTKDVESALRGALTAKTPVSIRHITRSGAWSDDPRYSVLTAPLSFQEMADAFRSHDVLIKTSRVEGMYGPPLEAFHCGCLVVTTPVTGHEEFIVDGVNSLVVGWDDPQAIGWALDRLNEDQNLRDRLAKEALDTARSWPSLHSSTSEFHDALLACLAAGSSDTDLALLDSLRALRSLRVPQLKMHVQHDQADRSLREQQDHAAMVESERLKHEQALLSEIEATKRTISWRVTSPLRWLRRFR
jgi:O-antigen biosynthesis protein